MEGAESHLTFRTPVISRKKLDKLANKAKKLAAELALAKSRHQRNLMDHSSTEILNSSTESEAGNTSLVATESDVANSGEGAVEIHEEISPDQLDTIRQTLINFRRDKDEGPRMRIDLTLEKLKGRLIQAADVQALLLYAIMGVNAPAKPKWCTLRPWRFVTQSVCIVVDLSNCQLGAEDKYTGFIELVWNRFQFVSRYFRCRVLMDLPVCKSEHFIRQIMRVSISQNSALKEKLRLKKLESNQPSHSNNTEQLPIKNCEKILESLNDTGTQTPATLTDLLLSPAEMLEFSFPMPFTVSKEETHDPPFAYSKDAYIKVGEKSPIFAIDCEMCVTTAQRHELTRISVIDTDLNVVFDTLVKPNLPIVNHLTKFSGITRRMMDGVTTRLADVHNVLRRILPPDAVIVGHSLNFDLQAMRMFHPYIVDLSVIFNLSGSRQLKSSLKTLAYHFVGESIQCGPNGHCSVEDAWATMKLVKRKLSEGLEFGNVELGWSYKSFADQNGMDVTGGKRHFVNEAEEKADEPPKKRRKTTVDMERPKPKVGYMEWITEENRAETCENCALTVRSACEIDGCFCRKLKHRYCDACLFGKKKRAENSDCEEKRESDAAFEVADVSSSNGVGMLDWKAALALDPVEELASSESLQETLGKNKKRFFSVTKHKDLSPVGVKANDTKPPHYKHCIVNGDKLNNDEKTQIFREKMLEFDFGIIELNSEIDSNHLENQLERLDEMISKIVFSCAKKTLLSLVFVNNEEMKNENALCCVRVKE